MDNLFLKYMQERSGQRKGPEKDKRLPGPVITISREYGCHGQRIATLLAEKLSHKEQKLGLNKPWRMISKEILDRSAHELKLTPGMMKDLSNYKQKSFFKNLALFFSQEYYPSDVKINNTIAKFIHDEAEQGCVVIVGRAGEAITKNIKQAFHVKMQAPLDWRAEIIAKEKHLSLNDARKKCIEQDKHRAMFRDYFERGRPDIDFFDMSINAKSMGEEEIVNLLVSVVEARGFL